MASVNRVVLLGNVGREPQVIDEGGNELVIFPLCTKLQWKDKATGERKEAQEWHKIKVKNYLTKTVMSYVKKGDAIYLEGRLKSYKSELGVVDTYVTMEVLELLARLNRE